MSSDEQASPLNPLCSQSSVPWVYIWKIFEFFISSWRICSPIPASKGNNENGLFACPWWSYCWTKANLLNKGFSLLNCLRGVDTTTGTHSFDKFVSYIWYTYSHIGARILSSELLSHIFCSRESLLHLIIFKFITWIQKSVFRIDLCVIRTIDIC